MSPSVLIIPACRKGDGLGHLKRSTVLSEQLGGGAYILIPASSVPLEVLSGIPRERILSQPG